jgi:hypothetical protein
MVTQIARAAEDLNRSTDSQQLLTSQCSVGSANTHPWVPETKRDRITRLRQWKATEGARQHNVVRQQTEQPESYHGRQQTVKRDN